MLYIYYINARYYDSLMQSNPCSGYMAPEYAMNGHFSTKSDVYSYGVLVLEIVTGEKASGFQGHGIASDLLTFVSNMNQAYLIL